MVFISDNQNESTQINDLYENDKKNVEQFLNGESDTFDFASLKRLVISELAYNNSFRSNKICGFSRQQIMNMVSCPERFGDKILMLCNYMYLRSGYFKRLIDYFVNSAIINWTIDTEVNDVKYYSIKQDKIKQSYINFSAECNKFRIENSIHDILKRLFLNDTCYAFVIENELEVYYFFLDPKYCQINKLVNGNVYQFTVNRSIVFGDNSIKFFPIELQNLLIESKKTQLDDRVLIPLENSLCLKYNTDIPYSFPPFFTMISDILLIDDYKDISKTKAINDTYKLLALKIPEKDGKITMSDKIVTPFIQTTKAIVQSNIAVLPTPFDVSDIQFQGASSSDKDYVKEATDNMYKNVGVSQNLLSGSSSGSELKLSILNDNGDIFRIYRTIENWMRLQMNLRGFLYKYYAHVFKILDITIYNQGDYIDRELKLAQASLANKQKLIASTGNNPTKMLGNAHIENVIFSDVFDSFKPLLSSYTQSSNSDENGRPKTNELDKAKSTIAGDKVDSNDPNNRI